MLCVVTCSAAVLVQVIYAIIATQGNTLCYCYHVAFVVITIVPSAFPYVTKVLFHFLVVVMIDKLFSTACPTQPLSFLVNNQVCGQNNYDSLGGLCCVAVNLDNNENNFEEGELDVFSGPSQLGECYDFQMGTLDSNDDVCKCK